MRGAYLLLVSILLAVAVLAVASYLWVVNPYGLYGERPAPSTAYGGDLFWYIRLHKPFALDQVKPELLIIGSSRAARLSPAIWAGSDAAIGMSSKRCAPVGILITSCRQ